jgi:carboxymethylenebutenolidase
MGETVSFASNGSTASGYLATPSGGAGPGVLVLQEWWGLIPQLERECDRLASEGFTALAPDLYHGERIGEYTPGRAVDHTEMDRAGQLMNSLPQDRAARDMKGAIDFLLGHEAVRGTKVGVNGFCMGGALALAISAMHGDLIGACVTYYGAPFGDMEPDWSGLTAPVQGHFGENDAFFTLDAVRELEAKLKGMGKDVTFFYYPGAGHAFANEDNLLGTYDPEAARLANSRALEFLHARLG